MDDTKIIDDIELRIKGIEALNKALGPSSALRFLTLLHKDSTDYVEISRLLYEEQNIDEIFERANKRWKE